MPFIPTPVLSTCVISCNTLVHAIYCTTLSLSLIFYMVLGWILNFDLNPSSFSLRLMGKGNYFSGEGLSDGICLALTEYHLSDDPYPKKDKVAKEEPETGG